MCLAAEELKQTVKETQMLVQHTGSVSWIDHVTLNLLEMKRSEVTSFLSSMTRLGEPFVTGFNEPTEYFDSGVSGFVVSPDGQSVAPEIY